MNSLDSSPRGATMSSTPDSESPDSGRESRLPATSTIKLSSDTKAKKKKKMPPQEKINDIWERFSAPQFSKITTILPFATPTTKSSPDPSTKEIPKSKCTNLLVSEDFERAVQECRKRVQKLVKECRRVNMRYRDPDFDIDWDLKWDKGHCLNGLGKAHFKLYKRSDSTSSVPKSVKRVHEIFENPTFLPDKISPADIKQGALGNCWLIGSLTALANTDHGVQRICVEYDRKIGIYGFVFHRDGDWIISIIDDKLYLNSPDWDSRSMQRSLLERSDREDVENDYRKTYQTGSQALFFAKCRDQNETWLPLLEKAYAKVHGDYSSLIGGWGGEGLEDLTGGVTTELLTSDILDPDEFWTNEIMKVNKEFLFGCYTGLLDGDFGHRGGICERHAYVLMDAREISTGQRLVKLRNPWGKVKKGVWEGAWSDGSKEFTPEIQLELDHKAGADSVFWISYEDFLRKYQHLDRTRLFMDSPEWRVTQKWISVEVPWKAEFEQKFKIVLTKESPLVLVLSQLDHRYFRGLQGQYDFRLQFRFHEVDASEENDYIVRSHGNYLMERSVVTELKSIDPGTYSVFIQVVAERRSYREAVEEVIKTQTKKRNHNDKLASVGMSYDLAHSKVIAHLELKSTHRAAQLKAETRETKNASLHKGWDKRHLKRYIERKQAKKNQKKLDRREAKAAAKEKADAEKEPKDQAAQTENTKEDVGIQTEEPTTAGAKVETIPEPASKTRESEAVDESTKDPTDNIGVEKALNPSVESQGSEVIEESKKDTPADSVFIQPHGESMEYTKKDIPADYGTTTAPETTETRIESQAVDAAKKENLAEDTTTIPKTALQAPETQEADATKKEIPADQIPATIPEASAEMTPQSERSDDTKRDSPADSIIVPDSPSQEKSGSQSVANSKASEEEPHAKVETTIESQDPEDVGDADKVISDDMSVSDGSQFTPDTPNGSSVAASPGEDIGLLETTGLPSPQGYFPAEKPSPTPPAEAEKEEDDDDLEVSSDGESSASPVSDFGDLSDDEPTPAPTTDATKTKAKEESEDDDGPEPWNAICVVGLRVYSQDEGLTLKICGEGEVEEDENPDTKEEHDTGMDADTEDEPSKKRISKKISKQNKELLGKVDFKLPATIKKSKSPSKNGGK